jgi:ferritin-like protein
VCVCVCYTYVYACLAGVNMCVRVYAHCIHVEARIEVRNHAQVLSQLLTEVGCLNKTQSSLTWLA